MKGAAVNRSIHFISGLPRSGSTLLAALLRQNERFHAEMSSPLAAIVMATLEAMGGRNEYHLFVDDNQRRAVVRGVFSSFYEHLPSGSVIFDTNRAWCSKLATLVELFPDVKVICCVRNIAWILDSFERRALSSPLVPSILYNFEVKGSVYNRTELLMKSNGLVGGAYGALKEAFYGPHASHLLLVNYESLAANPRGTLARIYDFVGEEPASHDFDYVSYSAKEFDRAAGTPGLHTISGKVALQPREPVLPPDLFNTYRGTTFWNDSAQNMGRATIV